MAQRVSVQLVDDLDGAMADETVSFALDGTSYEIDLSNAHAAAMRDALASYVGAARRAGSGRGGSGRRGGGSGGAAPASRGSSNRQRSAEIRTWAKSQGLTVNERGRIPANIVEQFDAANT